MIDTFSHLAFFGVLANKLFLDKYMSRFLVNRAKELKRITEDT
ncbi:hypothetical protein [Virgibacillus sp. SK37]|nr:hypothetical protein [Virgibacillus sp. SK37]AIF45335.1 hypothetical protein X953_07330 [Virgibacillus sp. SK37]